MRKGLAGSLPNAKPTPATRRREGAGAILIGTPAEIAARLRDYAAIGVTEICAIIRPTPPARCARCDRSPRRDPGRNLA